MGQRPSHVKPPQHLSKSPPVPKPAPAEPAKDPLDNFDDVVSAAGN